MSEDPRLHPHRDKIKAAIMDDLVRSLIEIEARFDQEVSPGADQVNRGAAERRAAGLSLGVVIEALRLMDVPSRPIERLFEALMQIEESGKRAAMFDKARAAHRPHDSTSLLILKGTVVAIAESLREAEPALTIAAADKWAAAVLKSTGRTALTKVSARTVRNWRSTFSGQYGEPGPAADAYRGVITYLRNSPTGGTITRDILREALILKALALPENPLF